MAVQSAFGTDLYPKAFKDGLIIGLSVMVLLVLKHMMQ